MSEPRFAPLHRIAAWEPNKRFWSLLGVLVLWVVGGVMCWLAAVVGDDRYGNRTVGFAFVALVTILPAIAWSLAQLWEWEERRVTGRSRLEQRIAELEAEVLVPTNTTDEEGT